MSELYQHSGIRNNKRFSPLGAVIIGLVAQMVAWPALGSQGDVPDAAERVCVYTYEDDFSDERVYDDSHRQSRFWVKGAALPEEPTLMFVEFTEDNPMLLLQGYGFDPAELGYRIPVNPDRLLPALPLFVEILLEVQLLTSSGSHLPTFGHLSYKTSPDGKTWGLPQGLKNGANQITPGPLSDHRYIVFMGHQAVIDSLRIRLYRDRATWRVPGDFPTIQRAVDAAASGDTIALAAGHYRGEGNVDIDFRGKRLKLFGEDGPENSIIDCQNLGRGFRFTQGESAEAVISDLTILGGYARQGGGIYLDRSSPTIANCIIRECVCESSTTDQAQGGGIYCRGGQPIIRDCWIYGNRVFGDGAGSQGGGLYAEGSALRLENCYVSENAAEEGDGERFGGGGLYLTGPAAELLPAPVLRGNLIVGNTALGNGAGLLVRDTPIEIYNCTVVGNQSAAAGGGAGIHFHSELVNPFTEVNSSILWGNLAAGQWNQMAAGGVAMPNVRYSQVQGGWPGSENSGAEPLFADSARGDYRLRSQAGRWSPDEQGWVLDGSHCPCIDTGDPNLDYAAEYCPAGERINRGAFGGRAQASKGEGPRVIHVDTLTGDDGNIGIRRSAPLATIQAGINLSRDGDAVLIWPGEYLEEIDLDRKRITVQSAADAATVVAPEAYAFTFSKAEGPDTILRNLIIKGCPLGGILCSVARPTLQNLTVVDCALGIDAIDSGDLVVTNSILWNNRDGDLQGCRAEYSCIQHQDFGQAEGIGNIVRNPRFVDPNTGNYHVQSRFGRYWPEHEVWVVDAYHSPAIDRGDPQRNPVEETQYNGGRQNMGAYGGTAYASRSAPFADPDLNQDGMVDFRDFSILAENWLSEAQ
jgi:hypothetical protein